MPQRRQTNPASFVSAESCKWIEMGRNERGGMGRESFLIAFLSLELIYPIETWMICSGNDHGPAVVRG